MWRSGDRRLGVQSPDARSVSALRRPSNRPSSPSFVSTRAARRNLSANSPTSTSPKISIRQGPRPNDSRGRLQHPDLRCQPPTLRNVEYGSEGATYIGPSNACSLMVRLMTYSIVERRDRFAESKSAALTQSRLLAEAVEKALDAFNRQDARCSLPPSRRGRCASGLSVAACSWTPATVTAQVGVPFAPEALAVV